MFPFLTFSFLIMAVILPSGRSSKGKPFAETLSQLEQHLPKRAQALLSPLSENDRDVLNYMLAFGLHLQMLAGLVLPASKLQWYPWKACSAKAGFKREYAFPSHSLQSVSGRPQKGSPLSAHKPSCSCDCFSCYSSFWSRWAASPNKDLLNTIIEIAEMADAGEEPKASKAKEKKKKPILEQEALAKKAKGGRWKLQSTPKISAPVNMASTTEIVHDTPGCTAMDVMYDAIWDNVSTDALRSMNSAVVLSEVKDVFPMKELLPRGTEGCELTGVSTVEIKSSRDARSEIPSWDPSKQGRAAALVDDELDGSSPAPALSTGGLLFTSKQVNNNLKFHRTGKRKSNQITPLVFEGTSAVAEDRDSTVSNDRGEDFFCPRLADANLRSEGFLLGIFPDALCNIASRLWDLVSMGSRNRSMDYY